MVGAFFEANGIVDADRKQSIFLTVIGPMTFKLLWKLVTMAKLGLGTVLNRTLQTNLEAWGICYNLRGKATCHT